MKRKTMSLLFGSFILLMLVNTSLTSGATWYYGDRVVDEAVHVYVPVRVGYRYISQELGGYVLRAHVMESQYDATNEHLYKVIDSNTFPDIEAIFAWSKGDYGQGLQIVSVGISVYEEGNGWLVPEQFMKWSVSSSISMYASERVSDSYIGDYLFEYFETWMLDKATFGMYSLFTGGVETSSYEFDWTYLDENGDGIKEEISYHYYDFTSNPQTKNLAISLTVHNFDFDTTHRYAVYIRGYVSTWKSTGESVIYNPTMVLYFNGVFDAPDVGGSGGFSGGNYI